MSILVLFTWDLQYYHSNFVLKINLDWGEYLQLLQSFTLFLFLFLDALTSSQHASHILFTLLRFCSWHIWLQLTADSLKIKKQILFHQHSSFSGTFEVWILEFRAVDWLWGSVCSIMIWIQNQTWSDGWICSTYEHFNSFKYFESIVCQICHIKQILGQSWDGNISPS